ncbi:high-affinity branched-chain amino acid transport system permease protein LivH [bacterium BMS3Abin02]|nr:high-affinity branched-chain amino acid transport system permease protein LivH [bacterium BMS3Abin02]GBE23703.1 high-affinity branched-chain amino acid transport system permease protein LivH [bacterium BMS3Bbin01]HDH26985.1 branched-chain amino acid ABC transporter permease [Actinomycetota bacterium]HDL49754.1 branched-chain amino acid ABC transporter permease [Actinomycetota bacterium]
MSTFIQLTINGLASGAILALAALGFVLIFKATGVINFAQGEFLLVGAYVVWAGMVTLGLPWPLAILLGVVIAVGMGVAIERSVLRPLVGESAIAVIMVTIGLSAVLRSLVQGIWGTNLRRMPTIIPDTPVVLFGAPLPQSRLWAIGIALVALAAFAIFFHKSHFGVAMRAVADDQQAAMVMGISVRRIFALSWALAAVSAVFGGVLVAIMIGVSIGVAAFGLLVFAVVIVGGLDSIAGALIGGLIIGLTRQYIAGYVSAGLGEVVPYLVLVLVLFIKPYGIFGEVRIERV